MAKKAYVGVNGEARNVKNIYVGVNGVARKVVKGYVGVNGVARLFWGGGRSQLSVPVHVSIHNYNYESGMANFEDALINPYTYESWPHGHMYFDNAALYNSGRRVNNNSATRTILSDSPRSISLLYTGILRTDVSSFTIGAQNIWIISNINYPAHSNIPYSFKVDLEIG